MENTEENKNTENPIEEKNINVSADEQVSDSTAAPTDADSPVPSAAAPDGDGGKEEEKGSFLNDLLEITESVFLSIFVVLLIFTFVARPVTVDGRSMYPTLEDEDKLIMNNLFYSPEAGDIVIIENNDSYVYREGTTELVKGKGLGKRIIKRVIAVGGQTVDIDFTTGTVKVDGEVREEPFIAELTAADLGAFDYPVTVPEGYVFVMGDNRNNSTDSRDGHVGFVKKEDIMGEAVFRFYPFNKFGFID